MKLKMCKSYHTVSICLADMLKFDHTKRKHPFTNLDNNFVSLYIDDLSMASFMWTLKHVHLKARRGKKKGSYRQRIKQKLHYNFRREKSSSQFSFDQHEPSDLYDE